MLFEIVSEVGREEAKTERRLRGQFYDSLDRGTTKSAILGVFNETAGNRVQARSYIGFPYEISNGCLVIGGYSKNHRTSTPKDYESRKKRIPIKDISAWLKIGPLD